MYVHAYQSNMWNLMVSRRFQEFGLEPQVGDLVVIESTSGTGMFFLLCIFHHYQICTVMDNPRIL